MSAPLLDIENLSAAYGRARVLFGLSLQLGAGEVVALVGRNGAGKTTTLKAVMGLVPATADRLTFQGTPVLGLPTYRIARLGLGYVPEDRRIFTDLTVAENLEVGRREGRAGLSPWTPERLYRLFPNLAEMQGRRGSQMSGGEQQMLSIARTLMGNPAAILLDEPSEGIAPVIVQDIHRILADLKGEGVTMLLVEKSFAFATGIADSVYVIGKGQVRWHGPAEDLKSAEDIKSTWLGV